MNDQKMAQTDIFGLVSLDCSQLNILVLLKNSVDNQGKTSAFCRLGIEDNEFLQRKPKDGLITKQEVRAVSLSKMGLTERSVIWDIGAGSGAVSIEASLLAACGKVIAIEKNRGDAEIIQANIRRFCRNNITVLHSRAPEGLEKLPSPSAVFIGGSDGQMAEIIKIVCHRLQKRGRIVVNVATLESLQAVQQGLGENGFTSEITQLNVSRSKPIGNLTRLEPLNPVFIISGQKEEYQCP
jgi:precorrin-6Y C5,15-methyltransferase (decarboxylating)